MLQKEALARISINKLLEEAGWRFFPDEKGIANIQLEPNVKIKQEDLDSLEQAKKRHKEICGYEYDGKAFSTFLQEYNYNEINIEEEKPKVKTKHKKKEK